MPRTHLSVTIACALALLGSAGCGSDDELAERSRTTETNAQAPRTDAPRGDTSERRTRTSQRGDRAGGSKKQAEEKTRRRGGSERSNPRGKDEPKDRRGPRRSDPPDKDEPTRVRRGPRRDVGPPANRAFRPLTRAALRRCVTRAAKQRDPDRRLRAQARCVGLTVRQMRRQIRRACRISARKARNRRAAERRCLKAALG